MKALNENVRERYNYAKRTIDDPRMTAQQKAQAANSVMDAADKMRYALDELQVVGAQKDVNAIREFLLSIYGDMMRYTNISSGGISGVGGIGPDRAKCSSERAGRAGIPRSADRAGPPCCSVTYRSYRSRGAPP